VFPTYFLIASGDIFRRKMVRSRAASARRDHDPGPRRDRPANPRYLIVQLFISALRRCGDLVVFLDRPRQAAVWGRVAAVLNLVPYLGSLVLIALSTVVASYAVRTLDAVLLMPARRCSST